MIARAPGKVVLSGAYAVLEGAPALVAAVDRYVSADASRAADFVSEEVRAALGSARAPWFDASELRRAGKKLGLGSSAAILVASLAAIELSRRGPADDRTLAAAVYERALAAHHQAQRGGSGVDIAASTHGGVLLARRGAAGLSLESVELPAGLSCQVFFCGEPASTTELVARVRGLKLRDARRYDELMSRQAERASEAARAVRSGDLAGFVRALGGQRRVLQELGTAAGVPIVTAAVAELAELAEAEGAAFLPAGAGGGDVAVHAGSSPPSAAFERRAVELGLELLGLDLGARGVHAARLAPV